MNANDKIETGNHAFSNPVPHYVERYGLSAAPFSSQHEDRFVYLDAERLQRLNMLEHLTRYSELLLIITGPKGIGKSSLLQRFVLNTDEDTRVSQVNASPMMDANALLQSIARGFGLNPPDDDPVALQDALYHHLANLHHQEKTPLLVIDDAHVLPQAALETLFNLADAEASDGNLLRIILFSDPQIETMLQSPAIRGLRERVTHSMAIPPLDEEQTVGYIRHRLQVAGLQGNLPFSSKELHKIFRNSAGIPARINECAHLILNGDKLDQAVKDFHTPKLRFKLPALRLPAGLTGLRERIRPAQIVLALVAVTGVSLGLIYQDEINALFAPASPPPATQDSATPPPGGPINPAPVLETITSQETPTAKPEPVPVIPDTRVTAETPAVKPETVKHKPAAPVAGEPAQAQSPKAKIQSEVAPTPIAEPTPKIAPAPKPAPEPAAPLISDVSPNPVKTSRQPQTIALLGEHFSKDMQVTVFWSGGQKTLSAQQISIISPNEMELRITVGRQPDNWKIRLTDPLSKQSSTAGFKVVAAATKKAPPASSPTPSRQTLHGEDWIAAQNPKHFTLQLMGGYQKSRLQDFVKQHKLQDVARFSRLRNDRPWHVLIQGRYASRAKAEAAARRITTTIRGVKPWIRPFADIQKTLEKQAVVAPPTRISKNPTPPSSGDKTTSAAWIWSQDPSHYTLQLLGGQTEAGIRRFIQQHKLSGKAVYYRTTRNQRPWFVLIYHSYADRAAARAAISSLPPALRKTQPWARSFASIHAEILPDR